MDSLYQEMGILHLLDDNKKFKIPSGISNIRIDVGLASDAPNSAMWLEEHDDRFVFGIEPLEDHWDALEEIDFGDRFCGIKGAISDTYKPTKKTFYHMKQKGASSLLEPTEKHSHELLKEEIVNTFSLEFILEHLPWHRFQYVEHIKTDCEGYDFEAIKSLGIYLQKIVFISSEVSMNNIGRFEGVDTDKYDAFGNHMFSNNFSMEEPVQNQEPKFRNNKFFSHIQVSSLDNHTIGL